MAFVNGKWNIETDTVAPRVQELIKQDNPLIQQARSQGLATSNRRGMLNSSMSAGAAQGAAYAAALPIAQQDAAQTAQKNLAEMDRYAQKERLDADAGYTAARQQSEIAARMNELTAKAGFDATMNRENIAATKEQQIRQIDADMARLQFSSNAADQQQMRDLAAQKERLLISEQGETTRQGAQLSTQERIATAGNASSERIAAGNNATQSGIAAMQVQAQLAAMEAEMQRLQYSTNAAERQQAAEIAAQRDRLLTSIGADAATQTRTIEAQRAAQLTDLDAQMQRLQASNSAADQQQVRAIEAQRQQLLTQISADVDRDSRQATNAESLARLQGNITSALQTQQDAAKMTQLAASFAQESAMSRQQNDQQLAQIAAQGDQQLRTIVEQGNIAREQLEMNIAAQDRERIANSMIQVFQAESTIRAQLLSNPQMPASERAAYERAISSLGNPARNYINALYGGTTAPAPQSSGLAAGLNQQQAPTGLAAGLNAAGVYL